MDVVVFSLANHNVSSLVLVKKKNCMNDRNMKVYQGTNLLKYFGTNLSYFVCCHVEGLVVFIKITPPHCFTAARQGSRTNVVMSWPTHVITSVRMRGCALSLPLTNHAASRSLPHFLWLFQRSHHPALSSFSSISASVMVYITLFPL